MLGYVLDGSRIDIALCIHKNISNPLYGFFFHTTMHRRSPRIFEYYYLCIIDNT